MADRYADVANRVGKCLMRQSDVFVSFSFEYPGFIALRTNGGGLWNIGTADGNWGADLYIDEESYVEGESPDHSISTSIGADSMDVGMICEALYSAMVAIPTATR